MGLDKGFLSMLEARVDWERFLGEDLFGNENYAQPVKIAAYVGNQSEEYGSQDGQGQQESQTVSESDLFTDSVGVGVKDRFLVEGQTYYAIHVSTGRDASGQPLYHEVKIRTAQRG